MPSNIEKDKGCRGSDPNAQICDNDLANGINIGENPGNEGSKVNAVI